jgi:hypothetical protein
MQLLAAGHRLTEPCRDAANADRLGQCWRHWRSNPRRSNP